MESRSFLTHPGVAHLRGSQYQSSSMRGPGIQPPSYPIKGRKQSTAAQILVGGSRLTSFVPCIVSPTCPSPPPTAMFVAPHVFELDSNQL
jgi:hypothetical protein